MYGGHGVLVLSQPVTPPQDCNLLDVSKTAWLIIHPVWKRYDVL